MNRFQRICPAALTLALLSVCGPATAQSFTLPEIGLQASGPCRKLAVRDRDTKAMAPLGCLSSGKWSLTPDTLQILGPGSVGDVSTMSVTPDGSAAANTLAKRLHAPTFPGAVVAQDTITAPGTGAFFTAFNSSVGAQYGVPTPSKVGAKVNRINDRLLVGAATVNTGDFPPSTKDWYEQLESGDTHPLGFRTSWAQTASISTNGGIGVLGAARTSDIQLPTFQLAMGGLFAAYNDNTTSQQLATALYAVAFRKDGAGVGLGAGTVGGEIDIANKGNSLKITPANVDDARGHTTALKLNSGAAIAGGANAASAGLTFGNNRGQFLTGLIFAQNAIAGVTLDGDGKAVGGEGEAMAFGAYQGMGWWVTGGSVPSAKIISRQLTAANVQEISFEDTGTYFGGPAGAGRAFATLYPGGATGAYLSAVPAFGSNAPTLTAQGATNSDLAIQSRGSGSVVLVNETTEYARIGAFGMKLRVVTVAQLPTCNSATRGAVSAVSDAGTPTYNAAVTGGGTNSLPVYCNGTAWTMH